MRPRHLVLPAAAVLVSVLGGYAAVRGGSYLEAAVALPIGLGGALLVARRPAAALLVLTLALPFYPDLFGRLLISGVPAGLLAAARFWKELVLAGILIAAFRRGLGRLDGADVIAGFLVFLIVAYLVLPGGADFNTKLIAARQEGAFVLLFLACRRLQLSGPAVDNVLRGLVAAGLVLTGFAIWNTFWPDTWAGAMNASGYLQYEHLDLGSTGAQVVWYGELTGKTFIRAGSLLLSPLTLAYFLLIPLGLLMAGADGLASQRWLRGLALAGIATGLVLTLTRSAILLAPVLVLLLLAAGRARTRGAATAAVAAALVWPVATSVGLVDRLLTAIDPSDPSGSAHLSILGQDFAAIAHQPLGRGLATAGSASQRLPTGGITTESWYFQIGSDLGVLGLILAVLLVLLTVVKLWHRSRSGSPLATGALLGLAGVALGGLVLQTFDDIAVAWPVWMLAGLATPPTASAAAPARAAARGAAPGRFREVPA